MRWLSLCLLFSGSLFLTVAKPQDPMNLYGMDESQILQAAFAQAGIGLSDGISFGVAPTRKPSIFSAARLRNIKLPSFRRNKSVMPPMPMLVPIMGTLPKPLKIDGEESQQLLSQLTQNGQLLTMPPFPFQNMAHTPSGPASSTVGNVNENSKQQIAKALDSVTNYHLAWISSPSPTGSTTTPATPLADSVKRLPTSLTRPRSVNHNYATGDSWTPTHYAGYSKGLHDAIAAPSSLIPTSAATNFSDYFQTTKRFWTKRPFTTTTKFNETHAAAESTIEDLLKFHPIKIKTSQDNKLPLSVISQASLLDQINKDSDRRSIDCKNKDLGWCDYADSNYPSPFVLAVIKECRDVIDRMYVETPTNLADFDEYVPFAPISNGTGEPGRERASHATWSWAGYRSKNKALCDAERKFVRPSVAQDITGRWFVVVQSSLYHQQIPVEVCRNPGGICNNIGSCGTHARCVQKFTTQLLISIDLDKENDCPSMRLYRFPTSCNCDAAFYS